MVNLMDLRLLRLNSCALYKSYGAHGINGLLFVR